MIEPIIIDSFAGGGGASTGIEIALGRSPDIAINHNPAALALHEANHPQTLHISENVYRIDPLDYLRGAHVGLAWFSPDCKHFSKAKGGKPVERNIRDLAWIIPGWIERIQKSGGRVDVAILENVEEFQDYGPLIETPRGLMPDPERKGEYFRKWCRKIRALGGRIQWRELRACDYGAPTIRKRFFAVIRFDGLPIVWPEPTHGTPADPDVIAGRKLPWRTAAEIIDWSLHCPSIFGTAADIWEWYGVRSVRPLADNTMARVARGMKRYVLDADRPFLVNLTHGGRVEPADEPFKTVTGAHRGEKAVVSPHLASVAHGDSGGRREYPLDEPHGVVTAGGISHALIAPHVMTMRNAGKPFNGADEPTHTVTAGGAGLSLVAPALVQIGYGEREGQAPRVLDIDKPLGTVVAGGIKHALASAFVERQFGTATGHGMDDPARSVMSDGGGGKSQLISAFVAQHNNDGRREGGVNPGRAADKPLSTVTRTGSQQSVVAPYLQAYYGTGDGGEEDAPVRTVTTKDRHGHVEATLDVPPFTPAHADRARQVAAFLRSYGFWDDREFVTISAGGVT